MRTHHPDFAREQSYIDHAHDCHHAALAEARAGARHAVLDKAADRWAAHKLRQMAAKKAERLGGVDTRRLVFGRLDFQDPDRKPAYVGPVTVRDREKVVVVDFTSPKARGFYRATDTDPMGLARRRSFDVNGRTLIDISDEVFAALAEGATVDGPTRTVLDRVAAELEHAREPAMRQIVASIVADQYRMIEAPREGLFVIQGGPGTGKTAVALHRAVFLMRRNENLGKVLVVGPNAAFMAYIADVLPGLGERDVDQIPIDRLANSGENVASRDRDTREQAAVKGTATMADVLQRAIWGRIRPTEEDYELRFQGLFVTFPAEHANEILESERVRERPYMEGRRRFLEAVRTAAEDILEERMNRTARLRGVREHGIDREDVRRHLSADPEWSSFLDRMWPPAGAAGLVHELLSTEQRLRQAAAGLLTDAEIRAILRRGVTGVATQPWTRADLVLIDEARTILQGADGTYGYVIVDEAQDLTPMELRMVSRRAGPGDMTIVGDIAQATGPCRHENWDSILAHLPAADVRRDELTIGYRVPRSIMALANLLLPRIAPELTATEPVRDARFDPAFERASDEALPEIAAALVANVDDEERKVGVIVPSSRLVDVRGALAQAAIGAGDISTDQLEKRVTLLTAAEAKGLEFDHVVVVEPMAIVTESPTGWAELYVALTRSTQQLVVVHAAELPLPLPGGIEPELPAEADDTTSAEIDAASTDEGELDLDLDLDLNLDVDIDEAPTLAAPDALAPALANVAHIPADEQEPAPPEPATEPVEVMGGPEVRTPEATPETIDEGEQHAAVADAVAATDERTRPPESPVSETPGLDRRRADAIGVRLGGDFSEALVLAKLIHQDMPRAGTAIPYISHLLGTVALVLEDGGTETEAIAALLHDAIEDGPSGIEDTIRTRFGPTVAAIVRDCSDPDMESFRERKQEHILRLEAGSRSSRRVALAEKLDNALALLRDLERYGEETWKARKIDRQERLWYLNALVALFARSFPSVLANEFASAVERIEELAGQER